MPQRSHGGHAASTSVQAGVGVAALPGDFCHVTTFQPVCCLLQAHDLCPVDAETRLWICRCMRGWAGGSAVGAHHGICELGPEVDAVQGQDGIASSLVFLEFSQAAALHHGTAAVPGQRKGAQLQK